VRLSIETWILQLASRKAEKQEAGNPEHRKIECVLLSPTDICPASEVVRCRGLHRSTHTMFNYIETRHGDISSCLKH
jgi:hypothetical protein